MIRIITFEDDETSLNNDFNCENENDSSDNDINKNNNSDTVINITNLFKLFSVIYSNSNKYK